MVKELQKVNDIIKNKNIKRTIDKTHFHDLTENLAQQYIEDYEKLFLE